MRFDRHDEIYHLRHTLFFRFFLWGVWGVGVGAGAGAGGRHFGNQNLKNRKLKRKRKQKRKRGSLREGREAPPRRCPHPFRFCFRFRFNFRFFKFLFLYVYVLIFNRPVSVEAPLTAPKLAVVSSQLTIALSCSARDLFRTAIGP